MRTILRLALAAALLALLPLSAGTSRAAAPGTAIKHVVVITFDNVHLSEIEQMPHLMAFLRQGTIFDNDHTVLNSHTQPDLTSFISGAYPDKTGIVDQGFFDHGHYVTWSYWENQAYAHLNGGKSDIAMGHNYVMVQNPWKAFNDHGWDVGVVSGADMALENPAEVRQYGVMNAADTTPADYLGYAIHCAAGSSNCAGASAQTPPHTIFGSPNLPWLFNAPLLDGSGKVGPFCDYANWCVTALSSLSATYAMLAHGIPVTYSYIDDAHHQFAPNAPGHKQVIAQYDQAFNLFFQKLAGAGITPANTLFMLTADEGDHYVYPGQYGTDLPGWMQRAGIPASDVHNYGDSAPPIYLANSAEVTAAERSLAGAPNWQYIATTTGLEAIHNSTSATPDLAARQPSVTLFGNANTWWNSSGTSTAFTANPHAHWVHGTISPDINTTWLSAVGPGIQAQQTGVFIDHVDAAPTLDWLLGWPVPSYMDGRILYEVLDPRALPASITANPTRIEQLAMAYKEINAPLGAFARAALLRSTQTALHAGTTQAQQEDQQLAALVARRNALAPQLQAAVNGAAQGTPVSAVTADNLLQQVRALMDAING